jgi:dihydrofolate reductase
MYAANHAELKFVEYILSLTQHLYTDGGITIAQFLQAKLVDEMILTIIPILLGKGIRLFNPITVDTNCQLLRPEIYSTGIVQLHYALVKA